LSFVFRDGDVLRSRDDCQTLLYRCQIRQNSFTIKENL